jgi:hypothetical protein
MLPELRVLIKEVVDTPREMTFEVINDSFKACVSRFSPLSDKVFDKTLLGRERDVVR